MKTVEFDPELMRKVTECGQRILRQLMSMKTYSIKVDGKRMGTIQALDIFAACTQAKTTWPKGRCIEVSPVK